MDCAIKKWHHGLHHEVHHEWMAPWKWNESTPKLKVSDKGGRLDDIILESRRQMLEGVLYGHGNDGWTEVVRPEQCPQTVKCIQNEIEA